METCQEVNSKIVGILRISNNPVDLYAAQRIENLENEITRLTGFLERIRDGKICRRCIKENANGYILMNDEDGSPHDCAREIAREALKECK